MLNEELDFKRHSSNEDEAKLFIEKFMNHPDKPYKKKLSLKHLYFKSLLHAYHAYIVTDYHELYIYDYDEKIYRNDDQVLRKLYLKVLRGIPTDAEILDLKYDLIYNHKQFALTKEDYHEKDNSEFFKQLIPVQNGVINRQTKELIDYDITLFFKNKLDIIYQPDVSYPDDIYNINEFILNAANNDQDRYNDLMQLINYSLTGYNHEHKLILFLGAGGSGKSAFGRLLKSMIGSFNCANLSLDQFKTDHYISALNNKLLNIGDDFDYTSKLKKFSQLAQLVTGEGVEYHEKYQRGRNSFLKSNKLIIQNLVELPIFDQYDDFYKELNQAIKIYKFENNFVNSDQSISPIEIDKMINNQDVKSYLLNQLLDLNVEL